MRIQLRILNKEFYRDYENETNFPDKEYSLPKYATFGSVALDLMCTEDIVLMPGETKMIPTGLAIWIGSSRSSNNPFDKLTMTMSRAIHENFSWAGLIIPRSGLGTRGLVLSNTIGLIDEDYQGELKISAWNRNSINNKLEPNWPEIGGYELVDPDYSDKTIEIYAGDRIAQLMFVPVIKAQWEVVEEFSNITERGEGGFSSTGV